MSRHIYNAAIQTVFPGSAKDDAGKGVDQIAREHYGDDVLVGYPHATDPGPYDPETHEVIGYVAARFSGPRIPVIRRKAVHAD